VYLGIHCNTGSKRAFALAYSTGGTTVYLFTDATLHSVPRSQQSVYFCIMTRQDVNFLCTYSTQTVRPSPKLSHERHMLGMSTTSLHDSHCPTQCRLSCTPMPNTPRKYPF